MRAIARAVLLLGSVLATGDPCPAASPERAAAEAILEEAGLPGGLIVHLGCGDGRLTAALGADERFLAHGLDGDATKIAEARRRIRSSGRSDRVSFSHVVGNRLPYGDNLVNLLVAEDLDDVPMREVTRVLVPGGVACVKQDGRWAITAKPRPPEIEPS